MLEELVYSAAQRALDQQNTALPWRGVVGQVSAGDWGIARFLP
jgi:hypothetical protein